MRGDPDDEYIRARRTLLDALDMLGGHREAVVLVGAQAIYLRADEGDVAVAPFTRDADLALDPEKLGPEPKIEEILRAHGYAPREHQIGVWRNQATGDQIDFLVPEAMSGASGRRAARLETQGIRLARRTVGLEGVIVDNSRMEIQALEGGDLRGFTIAVAGAAALLVAKLIKIEERQEERRRVNDKDAIDVVRLLRAVPMDVLAVGVARLLHDPRSADVADWALRCLGSLFAIRTGPGVVMAARGLNPLESPDEVSVSTVVLARDLLDAVRLGRSPEG